MAVTAQLSCYLAKRVRFIRLEEERQFPVQRIARNSRQDQTLTAQNPCSPGNSFRRRRQGMLQEAPMITLEIET
jgi:hypothetical protein